MKDNSQIELEFPKKRKYIHSQLESMKFYQDHFHNRLSKNMQNIPCQIIHFNPEDPLIVGQPFVFAKPIIRAHQPRNRRRRTTGIFMVYSNPKGYRDVSWPLSRKIRLISFILLGLIDISLLIDLLVHFSSNLNFFRHIFPFLITCFINIFGVISFLKKSATLLTFLNVFIIFFFLANAIEPYHYFQLIRGLISVLQIFVVFQERSRLMCKWIKSIQH
ncbi:hypothetical protein M0811_04913 [Anaeramoeba ignava]|uniref:Uncharacterized protein n=1 Tax=Anaeramoeba ignava TaxID=1746090 RepID=A0A9Q0LT95_ANAIG|nr:hypothetical protein M0811_04913 [Anaeramoeba ignava]